MEIMSLTYIGKLLVVTGMGGVTGHYFGEDKPLLGFSVALVTVGLYFVLVY